MAERDYSLDALNRFLDSVAKRGFMKPNTAQSRKLAANKILGLLDQAEQADLRRVDIDQIFDRFQNLRANDYSPDSLQVYKSRLRSAITDFLAYVENPSAFKPSGAQRSGNGATRTVSETPKPKKAAADQAVANEPRHEHESQQVVVPVPLRDGLTVKISNLPSDLTEAEAARLAAIIKAYAVVGKE